MRRRSGEGRSSRCQLRRAGNVSREELTSRAGVDRGLSPGDAFAELGVDLARLDAWLIETQGKPLAELDRTAAGSAYRALRNDPELRGRLAPTSAAADAAPGAR
jgi:hypothetical protein